MARWAVTIIRVYELEFVQKVTYTLQGANYLMKDNLFYSKPVTMVGRVELVSEEYENYYRWIRGEI